MSPAAATPTTNYTAGQFGDTTYTKVFVGGLAWETQKDTMKTYFEQFGEILEAAVITDKITGRSKGYGFVTFREADAAMRACVDAAPVIDGRRANCNLASLGVQRSKPSTPNKLGGMGTTTFPAATAFPHYAIHQGIPFPATNLYGYSTYSPDYAYPTSYYNVYGGTNGQYPFYGASVSAASGGMITAAGVTTATATFYPYLNLAEGGHGGYATGQSYGVYPHHLYQYSAVNSSVGYPQYDTPISLATSSPLQPAGISTVLQSPATHHYEIQELHLSRICFPFSESFSLRKQNRPLTQPWLSLSFSLFHGALDKFNQGHPRHGNKPSIGVTIII
ncbi:uncharacterized protein LOC143534899 isoform X2 [Bidens hawaiensis]|uniref:uncharacterized protein LOC143534899 isoform X2 n=1 Tax=Bidens hawaiensis TaxID=980011 RepID=UPI00404A96B2